MKVPIFVTVVATALLLCHLEEVSSAKILAIFPHFGRSHFIAFDLYLQELAKRGHDLTVVSMYPRKTPIPRYRDIDISDSSEQKLKMTGIKFDEVLAFAANNFVSPIMLSYFGRVNCAEVLSYSLVQELIKSDEKYDLVITENFNTECIEAFAHRFKALHIAASSSNLMPWANDRFGNPENPSYISQVFGTFPSKMSYIQRLENTASLLLTKTAYWMLSQLPGDYIARRHFGEDLPPLSHIARNTSLILTNSHFSISGARPMVPAVIEVGGIHIKPNEKLPQDIEKFLNESEHGVIYFSMGSFLQSASFSEEARTALLEAFSELPQRILWKWESDSLPGQPKNVRTGKWLPQNDILSHPNVRLFVTHGGLMGTTEAVHHGVPMVVIPLFGDQRNNFAKLESLGIAVKLEYKEISKKTILYALKTVLETPSYRENAEKVSRTFRDRPLPPLETAIYWTEYVLRHKGAPQLRSAGADLMWFQYLLLDVIPVIILILALALYSVYWTTKKFISMICCRSRRNNKKKTQ